MGPDATKNGFGYHLEMYNEDKKEFINDHHYKIGDNISLQLIADSNYYDEPATMHKTKYVYVFAIDQSGAMVLYYPQEDGNVENKYPKAIDGDLIKRVTLISSKGACTKWH